MPNKKTATTSQQRSLRRYQIIMGVIGVIVILSMIISMVSK